MKSHEFVALVTARVRDTLPPSWQGFTLRQRGNQAQLHYGHSRLHYEVWVDPRYTHVEVGLHFEADVDTNLRLLGVFDRRLVEVRAESGQPVEAEHWTPTWARVHRVIPYERLDAALADETVEALAQLIVVTQPMLEEAIESGG
ncbi:MAG: hypothetical protein KIS91_10600 [Anaerolineae bacterium]|nr:hypothetical protein [Anaerolineae bacterium]